MAFNYNNNYLHIDNKIINRANKKKLKENMSIIYGKYDKLILNFIIIDFFILNCRSSVSYIAYIYIDSYKYL